LFTPFIRWRKAPDDFHRLFEFLGGPFSDSLRDPLQVAGPVADRAQRTPAVRGFFSSGCLDDGNRDIKKFIKGYFEKKPRKRGRGWRKLPSSQSPP
jgi:hypothetical protein